MVRWLILVGLAIFAWRMFAPILRGTSDADRARRLLNLQANATHDEVIAAHRRLMARVHPDAGGSDGLAAELNAARDLLLRGR